MRYRAVREQKKRGRKKKGKAVVTSDLAEWTRIATVFVKNFQNVLKSLLMEIVE